MRSNSECAGLIGSSTQFLEYWDHDYTVENILGKGKIIHFTETIHFSAKVLKLICCHNMCELLSVLGKGLNTSFLDMTCLSPGCGDSLGQKL